MLRAKFRANSVKLSDYGQGSKSEEVSLGAVYANSPENKEWAASTPSGQLAMTISNPNAFGQIVAGREYFIDIIEVPVVVVEQPVVEEVVATPEPEVVDEPVVVSEPEPVVESTPEPEPVVAETTTSEVAESTEPASISEAESTSTPVVENSNPIVENNSNPVINTGESESGN